MSFTIPARFTLDDLIARVGERFPCHHRHEATFGLWWQSLDGKLGVCGGCPVHRAPAVGLVLKDAAEGVKARQIIGPIS